MLSPMWTASCRKSMLAPDNHSTPPCPHYPTPAALFVCSLHAHTVHLQPHAFSSLHLLPGLAATLICISSRLAPKPRFVHWRPHSTAPLSPIPKPAPTQVSLRYHTCSITSSDLYMLSPMWTASRRTHMCIFTMHTHLSARSVDHLQSSPVSSCIIYT